MDVQALGHEVRLRRRSVLPFVGAGLTLDAGVPKESVDA